MSPLRPPWSPLAALLGLAACFIDTGAPTTGPAPADTSSGPDGTTSADPATTTTTTGEPPDPATTTTTTITTTTADLTTTGTTTAAADTSTADDCVPTVWYLDADGDLHGGPEAQVECGPPPPGYTDSHTDCNDAEPLIHPDAPEVCDAADNDCDGGTDEWPAAMDGPCFDCTAKEYEAHIYYLCEDPLAWEEARAACQALQTDLIVIGDPAENIFLREWLSFGVDRVWLGLSDIAVEDTFVWVDGSPLGYEEWMIGDPNDGESGEPGSADCTAMIGPLDPPYTGRWRDQVCTTPRVYACESSD